MLACFTNISSSNNNVQLDGRKVAGIDRTSITRKVKNLSKTKNIAKLAKSKQLDFTKTKIHKISKTDFFTRKTKITFTQLRKTFIKVLILCNFDLKCHIWMKIHTLNYAIRRVLG